MRPLVAVALAVAAVTGLVAAVLAPSAPEFYALLASSGVCGVTLLLWSRKPRP